MRYSLGLTLALLCLLIGGPGARFVVPAAAAGDPGPLESRLYSLIQQDRWQHGERGLALNPVMAGLARGAPHRSCGGGAVFHGRAQDMAERGYFSHNIPPCGALIFPAVQGAGVGSVAAAENIGWASGAGSSSADLINSTFMGSPDHLANILGDYNSVGIGAWPAPEGWSVTPGRSGVMVFAVIFARVPGVLGPLAPPPPAPPRFAIQPPPPAPPPAPPPEPPAPPPEPPLPPPTANPIRDHDGLTQAPPGVALLPASEVQGAAVGPAFLARFLFLSLLASVPLPVVAAAMGWRRRRARRMMREEKPASP